MRKLDDIVPPSRRREMEPVMPAVTGAPRPPMNMSPRHRFPFTTIVVVLLVIAASIGALFYFSGAKVEVTPNTVSAAVQSSFTATQSSGDLPFQVITAQKIASQSVQGSGTKTVNSFASGPLTIYNTQSKAQKLIANTRFATPAGLIFRIHSAVTIPAGSTAKPGSVTVTAYADQAGATYNVGPSSFTVPGLAGSPQASEVYGRSTGAMSGGVSGTVPVVDSATETAAKNALVAALSPQMTQAIQGQIPAGYVLVPGSATTSYQELTPSPSSTAGQVDVKEQATITAVVFPNAALAKAIAGSVSGLSYNGEPLTVKDVSGLTLTPSAGMPDSATQSFTFTLAGTANLTYTVDPSRIAAAVAGKARSAAEVALTNYPEVKRAVIILRPFWRGSFPQDPASISVVVTAP